MTSRRRTVLVIAGGIGLGGSERQLLLNLAALDPTQFERHVVVLNPDQDYFRAAFETAGVQLWWVPAPMRRVPARMYYLFRLMRRLKPDVVHAWVFHANPYAGLIGRLAGVPLRLGSQRNALASVQRHMSPVSLRLALYTVDGLIANSRRAAAELTALPGLTGRVHLLPNCVALPDLAAPVSRPPDLAARGVPPDAPLIGMVGNLRRQKNYARFVRALAELLPQRPRVHALLVGRQVWNEPEIWPALEAQIAAADLRRRIHWLGRRDDVPTLLRCLDLFCLTSDFEGTPNVVLEAMAAARPVCATAVGGIPELIDHGKHGLLVPAADAAGLVTAIERLLDDRALAAALGRAARRRVAREFDNTAVAARLAGYYTGLRPHRHR